MKKEKKLKCTRASDTNSESEPSDHETVPVSSEISCDGTFKFFKVGKASPSLEFTTILRFNKDVLLHDLHTELIKQHVAGIEIFKKLPAYDIHIHVAKKDKQYSAHTPQQWQEICELLTRGFSMIGEMFP